MPRDFVYHKSWVPHWWCSRTRQTQIGTVSVAQRRRATRLNLCRSMEERSSLLRGTAAFFRLICEELRDADGHNRVRDRLLNVQEEVAAQAGVGHHVRGRGRVRAQRGRGVQRGRGAWQPRGFGEDRAREVRQQGWFEPHGHGAAEYGGGHEGGVHVHCNDWAPGGPGARQYTEPCITDRGRFLSAAERSRRNWRRHRQRQHRRQRMQDLLVRNGEMQRELAGQDPAGVREALFGPAARGNRGAAVRGRGRARGGRARMQVERGARRGTQVDAGGGWPDRGQDRVRGERAAVGNADGLADAAVRFRMTEHERGLLREYGASIYADRIELQLPGDDIATVHRCTGSAIVAINRHRRDQARPQRRYPPQDVVAVASVVQREAAARAPDPQADVHASASDVHRDEHERPPAAQGEEETRARGLHLRDAIVVAIADAVEVANEPDQMNASATAVASEEAEAAGISDAHVSHGVMDAGAVMSQIEVRGSAGVRQDVRERPESAGSRKRSASVASDVRRAAVPSKRRTAPIPPSPSRCRTAQRVSDEGTPRAQSIAGSSSSGRGSRLASDYRGLSSLGDVVRMFTGVVRASADPTEETGDSDQRDAKDDPSGLR